jgi:hypothetical protein
VNGERQAFIELINALEDKGLDDMAIEELGVAFASYEYEMTNAIRYLVERLGDITVAETVEIARLIATDTLSEVLR